MPESIQTCQGQGSVPCPNLCCLEEALGFTDNLHRAGVRPSPGCEPPPPGQDPHPFGKGGSHLAHAAIGEALTSFMCFIWERATCQRVSYPLHVHSLPSQL